MSTKDTVRPDAGRRVGALSQTAGFQPASVGAVLERPRCAGVGAYAGFQGSALPIDRKWNGNCLRAILCVVRGLRRELELKSPNLTSESMTGWSGSSFQH